MAIDRKAYKADKKEYKQKVKTNKASEKSTKRTNKKVDKTNKRIDKRNAKADAYNAGLSKGDVPMFSGESKMHKMHSFTIPTGTKPKRSDYKKESAKQERKNLLKYNPVVDKSDDNENIGRGGKGPKPMSRTGRAKASFMQLKDGLVSRFQGSTPKIGKNELMKPVVESIMPAMVKIAPDFPSMPQPLTKKIEPIATREEMIERKPKKKVETLTKGQKRSYELKDAHS